MSVQIVFLDDALDDLRRVGPSNVPPILAKLEILETNPEAGAPLGGVLTGYRKLVVGNNTWRIVYRIQNDAVVVCEIWVIGARSEGAVYAEAAKRAAEITDPKMLSLKDVIARLGKSLGHQNQEAPQEDLVPEWLAERLIHTAKVPREKVAALTGVEAIDVWTEFCSKPNNQQDAQMSASRESGTD